MLFSKENTHNGNNKKIQLILYASIKNKSEAKTQFFLPLVNLKLHIYNNNE